MSGEKSQRPRCPECGAELQLYDIHCWLCGWSPGPKDTTKTPLPPPIFVSSPEARSLAPLQYSIGGLLVVTTVIAVCLGAFRVTPGLGILLMLMIAVGVIPAWIRAAVMGARHREANRIWTRADRTRAFAASLALTAGIVTAGVVTCGVVAIVAVMVACSDMWGEIGYGPVLAPVLLLGSPVVGLIVAGYLCWRTWPRAMPPA
jgi:hypothetical protein